MKKLLSLGVLLLFIGMTAMTLAAQDRSGNDNIRARFVGAWRLAWLEEQGADGKLHRADCTGQLVYTPDGHMSVQVMHWNPQPNSQAATNAAPVQYAQGGCEASFVLMRSTKATTRSPSTLRERWCGRLSAKPCHAHSNFLANS